MVRIWSFPEMGVPPNGWFIMENPIKMDDNSGYPHFKKPPYECGSGSSATAWATEKQRNTWDLGILGIIVQSWKANIAHDSPREWWQNPKALLANRIYKHFLHPTFTSLKSAKHLSVSFSMIRPSNSLIFPAEIQVTQKLLDAPLASESITL